MIYIHVFPTGDIFITTSPNRYCSINEQSDRTSDDQDTLTLEELEELKQSSETIDERIDRYFDEQGDNDEWIDYS